MADRKKSCAIWTLVALLVIAGSALARAGGATKTPFTATFDLLPWRFIGVDRVWLGGATPVYHVRSVMWEVTTTGYPFDNCYSTVEFNWNINRHHGVISIGRHWGTMTAVKLNGSGGWDVSFAGSFVDGLGSGKFVGHGRGAYEGLLLKGTYLETSPDSEFTVFTGYVQDPGGS